MIFAQPRHFDTVLGVEVPPVVHGEVEQPVLAFLLTAVGLSLCPNPGGQVLSVFRTGEGIGPEGADAQVGPDVVGKLQVGVEVEVFLVVSFPEQGQRVADLRGGRVLFPYPIVHAVAESGVLCVGRVEEGLLVEDLLVALSRAIDAEVDRQFVVKGFLGDVEFGHEVVVFIDPDDGVVVHQSDGCAVVALVGSAAEGDMVVLHGSHTGDFIREIGVIPSVVVLQSQVLSRFDVLVAVEHLHSLESRLEAHVAVIGDMKLSAVAFLGGHLDDTRSSSGTVFCGFCGIFENGEALDVGRIDAGEGGKVGRHSVDDDKRVVAAGERSGASHPYAAEHGHSVVARRHLYAGGLSAEGTERVGHESFVHALFGHLVGTAGADERESRQ